MCHFMPRFALLSSVGKVSIFLGQEPWSSCFGKEALDRQFESYPVIIVGSFIVEKMFLLLFEKAKNKRQHKQELAHFKQLTIIFKNGNNGRLI